MPESMSKERGQLLAMFGAEVVVTRGSLMREAVEKAEEIVRATPGAIMLQQFANPANPAVHYRTTGPEIWQDTGGAVDGLVAGVGTGGTITGVGRFLQERRPDAWVVAVEPRRSPVLSGGASAPHYVQGIGAGFVPGVLDRSVIDEIALVDEREAFDTAKALARREGILAGISSGAAVAVALRVAARPEMAGKNLVVVLPDTGERYLSSGLAG
jgi:cysteine synthase A